MSRCAAPVLPNMGANSVLQPSINQQGDSNGTEKMPLRYGDRITINSPSSGNSGNYLTFNTSLLATRTFHSGIGSKAEPVAVFTILNAADPLTYGDPVLTLKPVYLVLQNDDNVGSLLPASPCGWSYVSWTDSGGGNYEPKFADAQDSSLILYANWKLQKGTSPASQPINYGDQLTLAAGIPFWVSTSGPYVFDNTMYGSSTVPYGDFGNCDADSDAYAYTTMIINNADRRIPLQASVQQMCPGGIKCLGGGTLTADGQGCTCTNGCTPGQLQADCTITCPKSCTSKAQVCTATATPTLGLCSPTVDCVPADPTKTAPGDPAKCADGLPPTCNSDSSGWTCGPAPVSSTTLIVVLCVGGAALLGLILLFALGWKKLFKSST